MFIGEAFLGILGLDISAFAVGGHIVIFILGLEMVLGLEFFKGDTGCKSSNSCSYCISINSWLWYIDYDNVT